MLFWRAGASLAVILVINYQQEKIVAQRRRKQTRKAPESVSQRLARLRKAAGMTQKELADELGTEQSRISNYESGRIRISVDILARLTKILGVSADVLLGVKPGRKKPAQRDRRLWNRLENLEKLPKRDRDTLVSIMDLFLSR